MKPPAVYDTNVIVSGVLVPGSIPASLLSLAMRGAVHLFISPATFTEYHKVLLRPKFGFAKDAVEAFLTDLRNAATLVMPTVCLHEALDEPDNRFLECAITADAAYLVTGNKGDFPFAEFRGTRIVSPAEFAALLVA